MRFCHLVCELSYQQIVLSVKCLVSELVVNKVVCHVIINLCTAANTEDVGKSAECEL